MRKSLVSAMLLPFALASCAGGGGGGSPSPAISPTPTSTPAPTPAPTPTPTPGPTPTPTPSPSPTPTPTPTPAPTPTPTPTPAPTEHFYPTLTIPSGTSFAAISTAVKIDSGSVSVDNAVIAGGATVTFIRNGNIYGYEVEIPALGINTPGTIPAGNQPFSYGTFDPTSPIHYVRPDEFQYVGFGRWAVENSPALGRQGYFVFGYQTPPSGMPTTGSAVYGAGSASGVLGTVLIPDGAGGFLKSTIVQSGSTSFIVDFASHTITGTGTNNRVEPNYDPFNDLTFSASISSASFSGSVTTARAAGSTVHQLAAGAVGTFRGGFFGPNGIELAGVWTVSDGSATATGVAGGANTSSDRRLKRDIEPVGTRADGLRLYRFRYLTDDRVFIGVMAQDLVDDPRFSSAVTVRPSGLMVVDYARLDLAADPEMIPAGWAAIAAWEAKAAA